MALDPKKLATYMSTVEPRAGRKLPVVAAGSEKKQPRRLNFKADDMKDRLEHGAEVSDEQVERLLSERVGYMELVEVAKGFACGACAAFEAEEGACRNEAVRAPVSAKHGCCNLFWPVHGEPSFPSEKAGED